MSLPNVRKTDDDGLQLELSLSAVASAIADPSRVSMLCALMDGRAWTATELSSVANIAASTASAHLTRLLNSELITCLSQGRHRYYRLAGSDVAHLLETLMGISMKSMKSMKAPQPKTPVHLRVARTCYDHLAGKIAVGIYEFMRDEGWLEPDGNALTPAGKQHFEDLGAILNPNTRRKSSCACLDWSERRFHLGGDSGAALLAAFERKGWLNRTPGYREVTFTEEGKRAFLRIFRIDVK